MNNDRLASHICVGAIWALLALTLLPNTSHAAISIEHDELIDYYDYIEHRGYNELRDEIVESGELEYWWLEGELPYLDDGYWDEDWE